MPHALVIGRSRIRQGCCEGRRSVVGGGDGQGQLPLVPAPEFQGPRGTPSSCAATSGAQRPPELDEQAAAVQYGDRKGAPVSQGTEGQDPRDPRLPTPSRSCCPSLLSRIPTRAVPSDLTSQTGWLGLSAHCVPLNQTVSIFRTGCHSVIAHSRCSYNALFINFS